MFFPTKKSKAPMPNMQVPAPRKPWRLKIAVDFDGVLHDYSFSADGICPYSISGGAIPGALQWLADLYTDGRCDVAIYSVRSSSLRGRWAMKNWLTDQLIFEYPDAYDPHSMFNGDRLHDGILHWIKWPWFKPAGATIYLDDRAWRFEGSWPQYSEILDFRPWNKRLT